MGFEVLGVSGWICYGRSRTYPMEFFPSGVFLMTFDKLRGGGLRTTWGWRWHWWYVYEHEHEHEYFV